MAGVTVDFNANVTRFSSALDKATNDLNKFQTNSARMSSNLSKSFASLGVAIGGALSVTAFAGWIKGSIDAADHLNDLAQKTGTSVEALAGLKFAADQNGTSLESVANAAKKLATNMADNPDIFRKFGITAKDSTGALIQLADIFAGMPDGVEKTALAVKLMGKSGEEMIPFLNQGSDALKMLADEGARLNPITAEMAKQADQFNDDLAKLTAQFSALGITIAKDSLKPMTQIASAMSDAAREGGLLDAVMVGLATTWNGLFTDDLLTRQQKIVKELGKLREALDAPNVFGSGKDAISKRMIALQQELDSLTPKSPKTDKPKDTNQDVSRAACELGGGKWVNGKCERGKDKKSDPFKLENEAWVREKEFQIAQLEEAAKRQTELQRDMTSSALAAQAIYANVDPIYKASLAWEEYMVLVEGGYLDLETAGKDYAKSFGETTDQMTEFAKRAGENIQDAFSEFLFDPFKGGLNGMLDGFTIMLRKMAAEALASQVLSSIGNWGKTGGGAGSVIGGIAAAVFGKSFDGGGFTGGGSRSGGIDGIGGFPAILHPNETVIDHTKGQSAGKSVTVINNFTLSQPTDRRTQEQIAAMAGASIQSAMLRGA